MANQLLLAAVLAVGAIGLGLMLERHRRRKLVTGEPFVGSVPSYVPPDEMAAVVGRTAETGKQVALVVFTEATCQTCAGALAAAIEAAEGNCPVVEFEFNAHRELHARLGVDSVPTTVLVAANGDVLDGWIGRTSPVEVRAALAAAIRREARPELPGEPEKDASA